MVLNLSGAEATVEGLEGTIALATDRARDGEPVAGALTLAPSQGAVVKRRVSVAALDPLLSPEGWVYASTPPVAEGDPGRYHALFGRDSLITALQVLPARPDVAARDAARARRAAGHARRPARPTRSRARSCTSTGPRRAEALARRARLAGARRASCSTTARPTRRPWFLVLLARSATRR